MKSVARPPTLIPTAPFLEHPRVLATLEALKGRAEQGGASSMMFLPQHGARYEAFAFAYRTGLPKQLNILDAPGPLLRGTVVINVSGHATGGTIDRMVGWAEAELAVRGIAIDDDAHKVLMLRNACETAHRAFAADWQRTQRELELSAPALGALVLSRARYDALIGAHKDGEDVRRGNTALLRWFGATNTYQLRARLPDGTEVWRRDVPRNVPSRVELSTCIQIELPLMEGVTMLQAWPTGSAEVGSYREAREYAIHSLGSTFDVARQFELAEKYQELHPEVRWDTEHEMDDVDAHGIAPSPLPYQDF